MSPKSLRLLRIGALAAGWWLVVGVLAGIGGSLAIYRQAQSDPSEYLRSVTQFNIASALSTFSSGLGDACFAFLIASVLRMIEKEAPIGKESARSLMIVCCLSYVAAALLRFCTLISNLTEALSYSKGIDWLAPFSSTAIPILAPILYAASIFVLYTHFMEMVIFESEVA